MIISTSGVAKVTEVEPDGSGFIVTAKTDQGTTITTHTGAPPVIGDSVRFYFSWGDV